MNATAGAKNVSTVPTQALTLMKNPLCCRRPRGWRIASARTPRHLWRSSTGYQITLARPATETEVRIGTSLIETQSLAAFTHVVLNPMSSST